MVDKLVDFTADSSSAVLKFGDCHLFSGLFFAEAPFLARIWMNCDREWGIPVEHKRFHCGENATPPMHCVLTGKSRDMKPSRRDRTPSTITTHLPAACGTDHLQLAE
jgi:hypothetical protein